MRYLFLIFLTFTTKLIALIDLDTMEQPFVLEAKQIHVPGYPDAFNPSIIWWDNKLLMSFRSRNPSNGMANVVGFVWLDEDFNLLGKPQLLEIAEGQTTGCYIQDPRLFAIRDKLYMAYSDLLENVETKTQKRTMCIAEIVQNDDRFLATQVYDLQYFEGDKSNKFEKNWVPFNYQDLLLLAYTISPHKIFLPLFEEKKCVTISESISFSPWNWGELRGGTPAHIVDGHYLAFFHSSLPLSTVQSGLKSMPHYFMGAYLFESEPPFPIKKISREPIVSEFFYNGEKHQTWKPLQVIFPCGFIFNHKYIWVSYGRQDHEAWIIKLDKNGLLKSLIHSVS